MAAETRAACGSGYYASGFYKCADDAFLHALEINILSSRDYDNTYILSYLMTFYKISRFFNVFVLTVCAGADKYLIYLDIAYFVDCACILRKMRERNCRLQSGKIYSDNASSSAL